MSDPFAIERLRLDRRLASPLHRQIYERIRDAILGGRLPLLLVVMVNLCQEYVAKSAATPRG